jgi:hypothetical protein
MPLEIKDIPNDMLPKFLNLQLRTMIINAIQNPEKFIQDTNESRESFKTELEMRGLEVD